MSISGTNEATQSVPFGTPVATGDANAAGSALTGARSDHVHKGVVANEAWTAWTPTLNNLTQGSGTVDAAYQRDGRTIHYRFKFTYGSGSAVGTAPTFTLPAEQSASYNGNQSVLGFGMLNDADGADVFGYVQDGGGSAVRINYQAVSGSLVVLGTITATVPFTWASGDTIEISGTYEAAS